MSLKSSHAAQLGFIQGRLSPIVDGKIQAFPWQHWREEFPIAHEIGLRKIEWTLDQDRLHENPFIEKKARGEVKSLLSEFGMRIPSITGDCFMQFPFFKAFGNERLKLLDDLNRVIEAAEDFGSQYIVFPLVDNGSITTEAEQDILLEEFQSLRRKLVESGVKIIFESDFSPEKLRDFIGLFPVDAYGINYDLGNSASLGYDINEEFRFYYDRIDNIHIKDRLKGGTTVPLGSGNANFKAFFSLIREFEYKGNLIFQTARDPNNQHQSALKRYIDFVLAGLES
ncbi:MAG: sugar phosphate isomerase/epimerase [Bdellovibrionales bacterium]|nr:sugar phosphate isomerase/epimerase [Bdellovibrionales bacterium]